MSTHPPQTIWERFYKDEQGKVAIWQTPSPPLVAWFTAFLLSKYLPYGQLNFAATLVAFGTLFTWAWLELFQGACYLRRILGGLVLFLAVLSRL